MMLGVYLYFLNIPEAIFMLKHYLFYLKLHLTGCFCILLGNSTLKNKSQTSVFLEPSSFSTDVMASL